jgi:hypothetical protein
MSANDKFDREFEAFLSEDDSKLAALYRKLPAAEPDAKLDAAILAMAHRALNPELVATPASRYRSSSRRRWVPAFGIAAGVVFAAGIALRLGQQNLHDRPDVGSQVSATDVITVRPLDAPASPPLLSPPPPPQTAVAANAVREPKLKEELPATPPPTSTALARQKSAEPDTTTPGAAGGFAKSTGSVAQAPADAFPAPAQPHKRAPEMDAVERKQAIAAGAWQNLHEREVAPDTARAARPAAAAESSQSAPATMAAAPPPAAMSAPIAAKPAEIADKTQPYADDQTLLPPDKWLAHIHQLLRANQRDKAVESLKQFRKHYPQYRLPADLRDLH